jgi:hypothetical protein
MNRTIKSALALTVLVSTVISNAATHVFFRPQEVNAPREMVGQELFMNLCDMDKTNGVFSVVPEFTQSFRDGRIAECLIGNCSSSSNSCNNSCNGSGSSNDCATITISGSAVTTRGANDWLADYFGLPTDFQSTLTLKPRIRNFLVDLQFFLGLDELASGLYFKIHAPITWTQWNLRASENVIDAGVNTYIPGYFNATGVARSSLNAQALSYFTGSVPELNDLTSTGYVSPACIGNVTFDALQWGKFGCKDATKTRLADIEMALGWNFWCDEDYLVGLSIRFSAPTGNLPENEWLFSPVVGSEKHWKLGGALNAQAIFWRSEDEDRSFGVFLDARVQHLFKHCQKRTFDLCGLPNSRYMLAQRLGAQVVSTSPRPELATSVDTLGVEWQNEFFPVANLTASNVDINIAVEGDVALKFSYFSNNWEYDLGYNFYGRSCEKICRKSGCGTDPLATKQWTLKGDAQVVGFTNTSTYAYAGQNCVRLATSQSCATINTGVNLAQVNAGTTTLKAAQNPGVDKATPAVASAATGSGIVYASSGSTVLGQVDTSLTPVFITDASVDLSGTQTLTNKLFANISYSWNNNDDWTPFLGFGGEVEFAQGNSCGSNNSSNCAATGACNPATATTPTTTTTGCSSSCASSCGSCARCGLSQWGVWLKGGVAFN